MAVRDATYHLIKSLSKREKDLFMRYAGLEGQGSKSRNYVDLFRAINEQKSYDESALKKQFRSQKFIHNFSEAKRALREIIMRVLLLASENPEKEISFLSLEADELLSRGEWDLARKKVERGKELAQTQERFALQVRFSEQEKQILLAENAETLADELRKSEAEKAAARQQERAFEDIKDIYEKYQPLLKATYTRRGSLDAALLKELEVALSRYNPEAALPKRSALFLLKSRYINALLHGRLEDATRLTGSILELFSRTSFLRADYPEEFIKHHADEISLLVISGNYRKAAAVLSAFSKLEMDNSWQDFLKQEQYHLINLDLLLKADDEKAAVEFLPAAISFVNENSERMRESRRDMLSFDIARTFFRSGKYRESGRWFNKILDGASRFVRQDIQIASRLNLLAVYYELGESELLESLRRSTDRFISALPGNRKLEKRFLSFLNSKYSDPGNPKFRQALIGLIQDIDEITTDPVERKILPYFDLSKWLRSKA